MDENFKDKLTRKINSYHGIQANRTLTMSDHTKSNLGNDSIYTKLEEDLKSVNEHWGSISKIELISNRKRFSKYVVRLKKVIHRLISWYIDQIVIGQTIFNASTTRVINTVVEYISKIDIRQISIEKELGEFKHHTNLTMIDLNQKIDKQLNEIRNLASIIESLESQLALKSEKIEFLDKELKSLSTDFNLRHQDMSTHIKEISDNFTEYKASLEFRAIESYLDFEDKFRGAEALVEERLEVYCDYIETGKKALDIGCGRGELLRLLNKQGIDAIGIDINDEMIAHCIDYGFKAFTVDALNHLSTIEDESIDYIFLIQVVEHLNQNYLNDLIKLAYKKLVKGGKIFMETPNHQNLYIYSNSFYVDPTHVKPVSPHYLRYQCLNIGFENVEFRYISEVESHIKLVEDAAFDDNMNSNISKLNNLLFGYQDCLVISQK